MGIVSIKLPDIGEGIAEAELAEVYVAVGDIIAEDDVIADVMTDKATVEVPSSRSGKIVWIGGAVGDTLAIGADLIRVEVEGAGEDASAYEEAETQAQTAEPEASTAPETAPKRPAQSGQSERRNKRPLPPSGRPLAAPSVRQAARDLGIELRLVPGSGPAGRILHDDLEAFDPSSPITRPTNAPRTGHRQSQITGLRKRIAERMEAAKSRAPHITIVEEVDMTEVENLRRKLNASDPHTKLTVLPFVIKALIKAVDDYPELNAHFDDDTNVVTVFDAVHVGIATQTPGGLMVPVLRHAETLGLDGISSEIARLADAGRNGTAQRDELRGSTITISSLGPLGGLATTPILNLPEVAIVGINKISKRPMWDGQSFVPRDMMNLSCSFDHRIIDGWNAAKFIQRLRDLLETPALSFVDM